MMLIFSGLLEEVNIDYCINIINLKTILLKNIIKEYYCS